MVPLNGRCECSDSPLVADMADTPLISVLMPVFNVRRYITTAIESVLTQSCRDFEVILIDDGSSDGTGDLLERYAAADKRVRLIRRENKGLTPTLNEALRLARAPFLARMDGDDISYPGRFEKQVRFLQDHPDHVLVGCRCLLIDPAGRPICLKRSTEASHAQIESLLLRMDWPLVHPAVMMRTNAVRQVGGYDERWQCNEDHDLFLRMAEVGKLANLTEVLFEYRQHFHSAVFTKVEAQMREVLEICKAAHVRRGLPIPPELKPRRPEILRPIQHRRNWAWWALAARNIATARHHALAVLRSAPFSRQAWRLFYCALRGR